jgi:hypothetical protein
VCEEVPGLYLTSRLDGFEIPSKHRIESYYWHIQYYIELYMQINMVQDFHTGMGHGSILLGCFSQSKMSYILFDGTKLRIGFLYTNPFNQPPHMATDRWFFIQILGFFWTFLNPNCWPKPIFGCLPTSQTMVVAKLLVKYDSCCCSNPHQNWWCLPVISHIFPYFGKKNPSDELMINQGFLDVTWCHVHRPSVWR